jgi:DNA polymerase I
VPEALARIEGCKPAHPDGEDAEWSWGNNRKYEPEKAEKAFEAGDQKTPLCPGRSGALRALAEKGIILSNLRKATRIEYLRDHSEGVELLEALHQYYLYSDLVSDCEGWLKYSYEDGRLYPNVNPFSQVTGRSAFSGPALQNVPKEADEEGEISLRDCIRAAEGWKVVKADYAAQELRILADKTGDEDLIKAFTEGDPHVVVAEKVAGHKLTPGTDEYKSYRKLGKRANYGFSYGAGAPRYAQSVYEDTSERISEKQAEKEQAAFRKAWPGVYEWQKNFGARDGLDEDDWYALSHLGRRRYVGQRKDKYCGEYVPNYSDRLNAPIQMDGAEMLYITLRLLRADQEAGLYPDVEILLTTHDEAALEAPEEVAEAALGWLEEKMQEAAGRLMRPELSGGDCVEGEVNQSWGGK